MESDAEWTHDDVSIMLLLDIKTMTLEEDKNREKHVS